MIGKTATTKKKQSPLCLLFFLLFVVVVLLLMQNLNAIHLLSLPYQLTCNLKWKWLIFYIITHANINQEPSISSPPPRDSIFCSQIKNHFPESGSLKTRPLYFFPATAPPKHSHFSSWAPLPNLPPMYERYDQLLLSSMPQFQHQTFQAANQNWYRDLQTLHLVPLHLLRGSNCSSPLPSPPSSDKIWLNSWAGGWAQHRDCCLCRQWCSTCITMTMVHVIGKFDAPNGWVLVNVFWKLSGYHIHTY